MVHSCNLKEAEAGGLQVWGQSGLHSKTLPQKGGGSLSLLQLVNVRNVSNLTCPESNIKLAP